MIKILNFGSGTVSALGNSLHSLGVSFGIASTPDDLSFCSGLILPGVGSFDSAMTRFNGSGLREAVSDLVHMKGVPLLGICVGMQMLFSRSEEGVQSGLGWIEGSVFRLNHSHECLRIPHMGWNDVRSLRYSPLLEGIDDPSFYFLHSYYCHVADPDKVVGVTDYGAEIPSLVSAGNIMGVQFHPEKSHKSGKRLILNFVNECNSCFDPELSLSS